MAQESLDEKLKKVTFTEASRLTPLVEKVVEAGKDDNETVQVLINIKGYENRKDPKMTKDIMFPHIMRKNPSIVVIGGESCRSQCESLNVPFINSAEYVGASKEGERKKLIKKYKYFILCPEYQVGFNLREILKRRRAHFMCGSADKIADLYKDLLRTYRMKIRDWHSVSFPVGHCHMTVESIVENIQHGMQALADNLKKGSQNIKECFIKKTHGECFKLY